ncbi:2-dehydropantoate 2-reductase [candidate division KSB1 bacterium]|nr:2-dehydropantoate 2-reductase [candidate division KSB1 bacterium]
MRLVVIGAGAVGGVIAAFLAKEQYDVELVCKHRESVDFIENNGLRVEGKKKSIISYPDVIIDISQISEKPDIIFLATKAMDAIDAAKSVLPFLHDDTMVVSLQNGMMEDQIAHVVGRSRTIGCVVEWGATYLGVGRMEITSNGRFIVGELNKEITHRLFVLKSVLEKIFPVKISSNIDGELFTKLIINSCITSLGAVTGLRLGELLNLRVARHIFMKIFTESIHVADAMGIRLEKIADKINPYELALSENELDRRLDFSLLKKHLVIMAIGFKYRRLKSSSLQSLERGKPTEIDYLNGFIEEKARKLNIPVPVNRQIIALIKDIEKGKLTMEMENLYRIV